MELLAVRPQWYAPSLWLLPPPNTRPQRYAPGLWLLPRHTRPQWYAPSPWLLPRRMALVLQELGELLPVLQQA
jgi:hypothetical protein